MIHSSLPTLRSRSVVLQVPTDLLLIDLVVHVISSSVLVSILLSLLLR